MATSRRRPPAAERDARERLLDAAEESFAADGFDATPTARIAERADVGKGLLFYYFPTKLDLLLALLAERLPSLPLCNLSGVIRPDDVAGSLVRLARRLDLGGHESVVLRSIIFRELDTHPEVGEQVRQLRASLIELSERVLAAAAPTVPKRQRGVAARAWVAVLLDEANARRFDASPPDLPAMARIIAGGLASPSRRTT